MQGNCGVVNSGVRATQGEVPHRNGKVLNRTAMVQKRRESQRKGGEWFCYGKARRGWVRQGYV